MYWPAAPTAEAKASVGNEGDWVGVWPYMSLAMLEGTEPDSRAILIFSGIFGAVALRKACDEDRRRVSVDDQATPEIPSF